jgi:trimeric autotransporter adhesin
MGERLSPITTKGDMIIGDSAGNVSRLAVGVDGYVPVADAASPLGIHWTSLATGAGGLSKILATQNFPLQQIAGTIASKAGTVTGTAGFGSSLFLQRLLLPAAMSLSEIQMALSIGFPATNQGAGSMSRSLVVYSFGNSTSLASVISASASSSWNTGTSTVGASASLTQFQGGWSTPLIQPMTFNSSTLAAGEYVIGQLFDFAQGSSTWTLNLYGMQGISSFLASAATNLNSTTLGAMSSNGLLAASAFTASGSSALTAWTIAPTVVNAMSSSGLLGASAFTASQSSALTAFTAIPTAANVMLSAALLAVSARTASTTTAVTAFTAAPTAANVMLSNVMSAAANQVVSATVSSYGSQFIALSTAGSGTAFVLSMTASSAASSQSGNISTFAPALAFSITNAVKSVSFNLAGISSNSNIVSAVGFATVAASIITAATGSSAVLANAGTAALTLMSSGGLIAGSFFTAATGSSAVLANSGTAAAAVMGSSGLLAGSFMTASGSGAVFSNAGTAVASLMGSSGLLAGSFFTNTGSIGAVTNVALAALNSSTLGQIALPNFGFIGTGSTTSNYPTVFIAGIMSTGAIPVAITLTSTAVTYFGSGAFQQPWFLLAGG